MLELYGGMGPFAAGQTALLRREMRHYPNWLVSYLHFTEASEAPTIFHFWTGVSMIAGALRRRVRVYERTYDIVPNFYIVLAAPAGVAKKSTSINAGVELLEKVPGIVFGPNSGSWQGVGDMMEKSIVYFRYNEKDETEKPKPMSAMTIIASELGTFFRPDDGHATSFLTDMWDGKRHVFRHHTKHSGSNEIINPWLNIIGATTLSWIQENIPENMIGDGLLSRVIFVHADKKRYSIPRPSQVPLAENFEDHQNKLIADLTRISQLAGDYDYTPEANEWMTRWYNEHDNGTRPLHLTSDRFGGYLGRKQIHLVKLAIILAAAQRDELLLTVEDFETALRFLEETEHSMLRVFESIGVVDEVKFLKEMLAYVHGYGRLTAEELYHHCYNTMSQVDFKTTLRSAIETGRIKIVSEEGKRYLIAPQVH